MKKTEIVNTKSGKIQGYRENGLDIYKGIPFAEAPIDDLRFCPPVAKKNWEGILEASEYGPSSFQPTSEFSEMLGKLPPESEDCLNLNIWTPGSDSQRRPVMFWIHGGSFDWGGGATEFYDGAALANRGNIVVVTINYRLGALGYSYIPGSTANIGQLDQIAALRWVQNNIESFGGDPSNVTIFGESAGGYAVVTLPAMPAANGLFQRIIAQSAPYFVPEASTKNTRSLMRKLKLKRGDIEGFRKVLPEKIIEAQQEMANDGIINILPFRPVIDGDSIPEHPLKTFQNGKCKDIEFMIGSNLNETKIFSAFSQELREMLSNSGESLITMVLGMIGIGADKSKKVLEIYKKAREGKLSTEAEEIFHAIFTDVMFRIPTIRFLEAQSTHQPNTYNYMFTWESPAFGGIAGSPHAIEIPFVFNTINVKISEDLIGSGPDAEVLSEKVMDAWIAFAHTGNPNHDGIPNWPSYDNEKRATMFLGKECIVVNDAFGKEREAWDGLFNP